MKVISINDSKDKNAGQRKEEVLNALDNLREQIVNDEVTEFITVSARTDGSLQLHIGCFDVITAIGMFEIGKQLVVGDFNLDH